LRLQVSNLLLEFLDLGGLILEPALQRQFRRQVRSLDPPGNAARELDLRLFPLAIQDLHAIAALDGGNALTLTTGGTGDSDDQLLDDIHGLCGAHASAGDEERKREDR